MSNIELTENQLEDMLDRAAKKGASKALRELGLQDASAANDIREMRGLLDAWRLTKKNNQYFYQDKNYKIKLNNKNIHSNITKLKNHNTNPHYSS